MCYDVDAQPPLPPIEGSAASTQDLVLTSSRDGTHFAAFAARAGAPTGAGIVILPDVRGLHQFYKDLATRFAEAGVDAVAMDYFARTAGTHTPRDDQFDYMPHVQQTRPESIASDVAACVAYLRSPDGGAPRAIFTVGFCFGGSNSWMQATEHHGLAGAIGFYGRPVGARIAGARAPVDAVREFECPILGLFGGADQGISAADVSQFEQALTSAGIEHELHTYPGAPHSFFDRKQTEFADASRDAWGRMLRFISAHTLGA
jgi:carboxymethylenebutenolidase